MIIETTERILVIGDTHFPATHPDYVAFLVAVRDAYKLDSTLHVGDVVDFHAISYHETDTELPTAAEELRIARECLASLAAEFPEMHITQGNHDNLPQRRLQTHGLPQAFLPGFNTLFNTPETWHWHTGFVKFFLKCGMPVVMQHGIASSLTAGANKLRTASLIQGHHHYTSGVAWQSAADWRLFFLSVGCGVDPDHLGMAYAGSSVLKIPALGCGVVVDGWASHIPMWLDDTGRWNGRVP